MSHKDDISFLFMQRHLDDYTTFHMTYLYISPWYLPLNGIFHTYTLTMTDQAIHPPSVWQEYQFPISIEGKYFRSTNEWSCLLCHLQG